MSARCVTSGRTRRRAAAGVMVAISIPMLIGFGALAVDVGMLYGVRAELQRTADAAALAGALELLDEDQLRGSADMSLEEQAARQASADYAARNPVHGDSLAIALNSENSPDGDVLLGYLSNPDDLSQAMSTTNPNNYNSIQVRVRRSSEINGAIQLYFAHIFGVSSANLAAEATATLPGGAVGWKVPPTSSSQTVELLPFALHVDRWHELLAGTYAASTDDYSCDEMTGSVVAVGDGIPEINLYPGAGNSQLPPGNFGTVDVGSSGNSTNDIKRQILYGISAGDLSHHGGQLTLGSDGTVVLNGDTGLSAGFKAELEAIIGQPRGICLFSTVSGPGNNAMYTVVGFVGIKIVKVRLTGAMTKKCVVIQPAHLVTDTVITDPGWSGSDFIYEPPRLTR